MSTASMVTESESKGRFGWAILAYMVCNFVVGAGWHLVLFSEIYDQLGIFTRAEPIMALGVSAMLLEGLVLVSAYTRIARSFTVIEGARLGALAGLLLAGPGAVAEAAHNEVTSIPLWLGLEMTFYVVQFSLVGVVLATVYRGRRSGA